MSATLPKKRACGSAKAAADGRSASARGRARRPVTLARSPASIAARGVVWGNGEGQLCVSHARAVASILSPLGGRYCGRRAACAQAVSGE
eukprot:scaffold18402_cov53-Phaeocystis_antarctica.AAC.1